MPGGDGWWCPRVHCLGGVRALQGRGRPLSGLVGGVPERKWS